MGFSSLVYEVYSAKVLFLYFVESAHAVGITLSAFLAGLAVSARLASRYARADLDRGRRIVAFLQLAAATYALLVLRSHELVPTMMHALEGKGSLGAALQIGLPWLYLFLPGAFVGGAFPVLVGMYVASFDSRTEDTGVVYFWDTAGAIVGALAAGFVLIPWLGLSQALLVPASANLLVIALIVQCTPVRWLAVGAALVLFAPVIVTARERTAGAARSTTGRATPPGRPHRIFGRIVTQEASPFGLVTVGADARGQPGNLALFVGQRDMCHTAVNASERALGENAVANVPADARVLNIGLGCGVTAGVIAQSPRVRTLEIVEINPVIPNVARRYFSEVNARVLEQEKTRLWIEDGAAFLRRTPRRYDAIVIDIEEPTIVHSSPLYTLESFAIARDKLAGDGTIALWVMGSEPTYGRVIDNTLREVFDHVQMRVVGDHFHFYASERELVLGAPDGPTRRRLDQMRATGITEINTLESRSLERYFDIRRAFSLPGNYDEAVLSDAERAR